MTAETPDNDEIDNVLNTCMEQMDEGGSRWPGMSYEQGVEAALRWVRGEGPNPLDD